MTQPRRTYGIAIFLIILIGIASRKLDGIPLFVGDVLYATMLYFMVRFLMLKARPSLVFTLALLLCFAIEFQQILQYEWLVALRQTLAGKYILGQGFLWSDLLYYTVGAGLGYILDAFFIKSYEL